MAKSQYKLCKDCDGVCEVNVYNEENRQEIYSMINNCPKCGGKLKEINDPLTIKVSK